MIEIKTKDIAPLAVWLRLGGWFVRQTIGAFHAEKKGTPIEIDIRMQKGRAFVMDDRARFILQSFERRHLTAWAHLWGITLRLTSKSPEPANGESWEATVTEQSEAWPMFEGHIEIDDPVDGLSAVGDSPEGAAIFLAAKALSPLPEFDDWLDIPDTDDYPDHFKNAFYHDAGCANDWETGVPQVRDFCRHTEVLANPNRVQNERRIHCCPICRFVYVQFPD